MTGSLDILSKVKKSAYLIFIPLILISNVSEKLKTSIVFKLDFDLKIQKQHSHLKFMLTILIHIGSAFKVVKKSAYLTLIP